MTPRRLNRIVRLVNQQKPDLVVITGDLVTRNLSHLIPSLGNTLNHLNPKDNTIAILGNHDYENDYKAIIQVLEKAGIVHLGNDVFTLHKGQAVLHIAGVDDITARRDRLDIVLQKLPLEGAAILLAHEPDFAKKSSKTGRFDLQLSGHTHGGQIRFPLIRPPILPPWGREYYWGFYQVQNMYLYTNRGLGMTGVHFRFGARPEITVFTLVAPKA
jgi:predicted MPP superfamily phosphohydrolase